MKATKLALTAVLGAAALGGLLVTSSTPASAWYCSARATTGATGWGRSPALAYAKTIALRECAVRTPRSARCYIMYCSWAEITGSSNTGEWAGRSSLVRDFTEATPLRNFLRWLGLGMRACQCLRIAPEPANLFSKDFQIQPFPLQGFPKIPLAVLWDFNDLQ
jgi:hypothetical protein